MNHSLNSIIGICIISCILSGCIGNKNENTVAISPDNSTFLDSLSFPETEQMDEYPAFGVSEETEVYHKVWNSIGATDSGYLEQSWPLTLYADWKNGKTYPLCGKVNCMHQDESCPAYKVGMINPLYNDEFVYFFYDTGTVTEFYRQNIDGTDRKKRFTVDGAVGEEAIYEGDHVYFFTYMIRDDNDWPTYSVWCGNVATGDVVLMYEIDEKNANIHLWGKYQNELILFYQYYIPSEENSGKTTDSNVPVTESAVFSLDLENGEIHGLVKSQKDRELVYCLDLIQNGYLAYEILDPDSRKEDYLAESIDTYSGKIAVVNLKEKRTYLMPDEEGLIYSLIGINHHLLFHTAQEDEKNIQYVLYDLETGMMTPLIQEKVFYYSGQTESYLYGQVDTHEESVRHYILKDDYLSGKDAYVEFVTDYGQE